MILVKKGIYTKKSVIRNHFEDKKWFYLRDFFVEILLVCLQRFITKSFS